MKSNSVGSLYSFCIVATCERNVIEAKKNLLNQFEWDSAFKPFFLECFSINSTSSLRYALFHLPFSLEIFILPLLFSQNCRVRTFVTYLLHSFYSWRKFMRHDKTYSWLTVRDAANIFLSCDVVEAHSLNSSESQCNSIQSNGSQTISYDFVIISLSFDEPPCEKLGWISIKLRSTSSRYKECDQLLNQTKKEKLVK